MDLLKTKNYEGGAPLNAPISEDDKVPTGPTSESSLTEDMLSEDSSDCSSAETRVEDLAQGAQVPSCLDTASVSTTAEINNNLKDLELDEGVRTKRKRLSGAAKKRLTHLKLAGTSHDEALALCQTKIKDRTVTTNKRSRSDDTTPGSAKRGKRIHPLPVAGGNPEILAGQKQSAADSLEEQGPSYKDVVKAIRLEIIDQGFPDVKLSIVQLLAVQDSIMDAVAELPLDGVSPIFLGCRTKNGWLSVNCADKDTAEWLTTTVPNLKPWETANLKVVREDELPRPKIFFVYLPRCRNEDNEKILRRLGVQNKELRNAEWKILARKDRENDFLQLTMSVGHKTAETLKASGYKVNWLFGAVHFRPKKEADRSIRAKGSQQPPADKARLSRAAEQAGSHSGQKSQTKSQGEKDPNKPGPSGIARRHGREKPGKKHGLTPQCKYTPRANESTQGSPEPPNK